MRNLLLTTVAAIALAGCGEPPRIPTEGIPPWGSVDDVRNYLATCEKLGKQSPQCIAHYQNIASKKAAYEERQQQVAKAEKAQADAEAASAFPPGHLEKLGRDFKAKLDARKAQAYATLNPTYASIASAEIWQQATTEVQNFYSECLTRIYTHKDPLTATQCTQIYNTLWPIASNWDFR